MLFLKVDGMLPKKAGKNKCIQFTSTNKSGREFFFKLFEDENREEARKKAILKSLQNNRFAFLLKLSESSEELKSKICELAEKRWPEHNKKFLKDIMDYVDSFYNGIYRKDGRTEASSHIYSVAYGCLLLGCGFRTLIAALFHDLIEDTKEPWAKKKTKEVQADLISLAGKEIADIVNILTRDKSQSYQEYLTRIYQSRDMELMVVKAVDMIHNLSTLYFEGCSEKMKSSIVRKALYHVDIWRKFNKDFFGLMFALICDNAPKKANGSKINEEILRKIEYLKYPSIRQIQKEKDGVVIVNLRKSLDLSLFSDLPNSGSPVITVYMPRHLDTEETIEIEFPESFGTPNQILEKVSKEMPWLHFEIAKSALPPGLVCTTILCTSMPPAEKQEEFLKALKRIAGKQKE
ncbi:MAG: hypothetical protein QW275_03420 [Candidatus Anstonellaceae archaeon]